MTAARAALIELGYLRDRVAAMRKALMECVIYIERVGPVDPYYEWVLSDAKALTTHTDKEPHGGP